MRLHPELREYLAPREELPTPLVVAMGLIILGPELFGTGPVAAVCVFAGFVIYGMLGAYRGWE